MISQWPGIGFLYVAGWIGYAGRAYVIDNKNVRPAVTQSACHVMFPARPGAGVPSHIPVPRCRRSPLPSSDGISWPRRVPLTEARLAIACADREAD